MKPEQGARCSSNWIYGDEIEDPAYLKILMKVFNSTEEELAIPKLPASDGKVLVFKIFNYS